MAANHNHPERAPKFLQYVARVIRAAMEDDRLMCPRCGTHWVDPWNKAGTQFGICDACYFQLLTDAIEQAEATERAKTEYDRVRQSAHRAKKRHELEAQADASGHGGASNGTSVNKNGRIGSVKSVKKGTR